MRFLIEITIFDLFIILLIKRAYFDAHRTTMIFRKKWEAFGIIKHSDQTVIVLDWFVIKSIRRAITNAALTGFAKI